MIELKRDVQSEVVLNQLLNFLFTNFIRHKYACFKQRCAWLLNLKRSIQLFIDFRKDVILREQDFI